MRFTMNHRVSLALVFSVVIIGFVHCDEKKVNKRLDKNLTNGGQQPKNSTSSVVIENKVQNVSVGYKNDHGKLSKLSPISDNSTISNSVIISTSKEIRLIPTSDLTNSIVPNVNSKQSPNQTAQVSQKVSASSKSTAARPEPSFSHFVPTAPPNLDQNRSKVSAPKNVAFSSRNFSSIRTTKNTNTSSQVDFERMDVKEMKYKKDAQDNNKFKLYFVNDESSDPNSRMAKSSQMIEMNFSNKNVGQSDWMPSNGNGNYKKTLHNQHNSGNRGNLFSNNSSSYMNITQSMESVITQSMEKPHRQKYDITTYAPQLSQSRHKKFNSSQLINRLKSEKKIPPVSVSHNGPKPYKYTSFPNKKNQPQKDDSTLSNSKFHYSIAQPDSTHQIEYMVSQNQHADYGMSSPSLALNDSRKGYIYPSTGGLTDYASRKPENGHSLGAIQMPSGTNDLYHLDQLQPSGTSHAHERAHVMYETKEVHIPYPVKVEKKVPWPIHIKVDRPVPVHVDKPYPIHVEKKIPVPVKVHVPHPYPVEKEVPVPMKIPIDVPRPVKVDKPVAYVVEKPVPVQIIKQVKMPVEVPVDVPVPYKVAVQVEKRVPFFVQKKVPFEVKVPVERPHFIEEKKKFEVPVERPYPVKVEKKIPVPVQVVEFIKIPYSIKIPTEQTITDIHQHFGDFASSSTKNEHHILASMNNRKEHQDSRKSTGRSDGNHVSVEKQTMFELPVTLPSMISVEFPAEYGKEPMVEALPTAESPPQIKHKQMQYQTQENMGRQQQQFHEQTAQYANSRHQHEQQHHEQASQSPPQHQHQPLQHQSHHVQQQQQPEQQQQHNNNNEQQLQTNQGQQQPEQQQWQQRNR